MRATTFIAVAFAVSSVAAWSPRTMFARDYPACADTCIENANLDGCAVADFNCLCTDHTFLDTTTQCIYNSCTDPKDLKQAIDTANEACEAAGVTITSTYTPTQSRSATSSAATTTGSGASTTLSGSTASLTSTVSSTGSATSSASTSTSTGAAMRLNTQSGVLAMVGAAVIGAIAF